MTTVSFKEFDFIKKNMEFSKQAEKGYSVKKDRVAWNLVTSGNNCGDFVEEIVAQKFRDMGYRAETTQGNHPYDINITDNDGNTLHVEVKSAQYIQQLKCFRFVKVKPSQADIFVFCAITATGISNAKEKIYFKFFIVSPLKKRVFKDYYRHLLLYLSTIVDII